MPTIRFGADVSSSPLAFAYQVDLVAFDITYTSLSSTEARASNGSYDYRFIGRDFASQTFEFGTYLTKGTVDRIEITISGTEYMTVTNIDLSVPKFFAAVTQELSGTDRSAIERLITGLDYRYYGNGADDELFEEATSSDGFQINLRGNDWLNLRGGNDNVFAGNGNDTLLGGNGDDWLGGGNGNDKAKGGKGNDILIGGAGKDVLEGGNDSDQITGGSGRDRITGGNGSDWLSGGKSGDIFVFDKADGSDTIADFKHGTDKIELHANSRFGQLTIQDMGNDAAILGNHGKIVLLGVDHTQIAASDFIFA